MSERERSQTHRSPVLQLPSWPLTPIMTHYQVRTLTFSLKVSLTLQVRLSNPKWAPQASGCHHTHIQTHTHIANFTQFHVQYSVIRFCCVAFEAPGRTLSVQMFRCFFFIRGHSFEKRHQLGWSKSNLLQCKMKTGVMFINHYSTAFHTLDQVLFFIWTPWVSFTI